MGVQWRLPGGEQAYIVAVKSLGADGILVLVSGPRRAGDATPRFQWMTTEWLYAQPGGKAAVKRFEAKFGKTSTIRAGDETVATGFLWQRDGDILLHPALRPGLPQWTKKRLYLNTNLTSYSNSIQVIGLPPELNGQSCMTVTFSADSYGAIAHAIWRHQFHERLAEMPSEPTGETASSFLEQLISSCVLPALLTVLEMTLMLPEQNGGMGLRRAWPGLIARAVELVAPDPTKFANEKELLVQAARGMANTLLGLDLRSKEAIEKDMLAALMPKIGRLLQQLLRLPPQQLATFREKLSASNFTQVGPQSLPRGRET